MDLKPNPMADSKALIAGQVPAVEALFRLYVDKLKKMEREKVTPEPKSDE